MTYFWVNFGVQNDQKKTNLEEKQINGIDSPLNIDPKHFFVIFFKKYKIFTLFWYQVYPNRIKIEKTVLFYVLYFLEAQLVLNLYYPRINGIIVIYEKKISSGSVIHNFVKKKLEIFIPPLKAAQ